MEPEHLLPVLPLALVNGCHGIGTGWSTDVPAHNPVELVAALRSMLAARSAGLEVEAPTLQPWWRGFRGEVRAGEGGRWITAGKFTRDGARVEVTELPVGTWTDTYKEFLEELLEKGVLKSRAKNRSLLETARFEFEFSSVEAADTFLKGDALRALRLTSTVGTNNMHLRDAAGTVTRYPTTGAMLLAWFEPRLAKYGARKEALLTNLREQLAAVNARLAFVEEAIRRPSQFAGVTRAAFEAACEAAGVPRMDGGYGFALEVKQLHLTSEEVEKLRRAAADARAEITRLSGTSPERLWLEDLDGLDAAFAK